MDLSSIGYANKPFRVIPVTSGNIVTDFIAGKFQVIGVECNARGAYGSPIQQSIARRFPDVLQKMNALDYDHQNFMGSTLMHPVQTQHRRRLFVANMFLARGFGLGQNRTQSEGPINRFSERHLTQAFDSLVDSCASLNISLDRQIAVQRFYGGLGGVSWEEVCEVLDAICAKHKFNMLAYLPKNYNSNFVRGSAQ
ncbi:hypothetical protein pEaSNUABM14_00013 [Erwinia phage pEa_SNUABM_14]|uniref:Uncharacterized protein n=1 Tax=Erwinia phage pEa_SNUABM_7 TaxID=2866695 RepID=A0AAE7WS71_9CAUD|nr:hypothetical protein MPK74_gp013 [Erwinia phage pEa_SNUABM_7]QYW02972.1 hypothetical protein pEaSNUABM13_00013 [Erwinia phage pEa_SNUABM_13]QYW03315.1 hypothetical protein pEaSNUABM34_00013 [Erwinia phage pEa_SNUABM_34]QYW03656.1 hypothetical protein pEaSNUABM45_00013 [Erwinia phage pEa_SNUABM_45]QYW03997.1 hypothetical protein pEaSNUABM46_00013 [Erwinia phage pEa_SNUABM_46]QYW04338.1 hypothetical protein pEaSNUABM14_00013 [Erwinia phage pEa_SNUABM_14]QYW05027.1 hypothetical protein pEaSNU